MKRLAPVPMARSPRVSVVVPCYNYGRFLPECVASVLEQDGVDVDVLIVDDASPDGSAAVAEKLAADDARVRVRLHEVNAGHIATYNDGLSNVDGEYVVLLSADDLLAPGSLARSVALMEANPEVGFVYGFSPSFSAPPLPPARSTVSSWSLWDGPEWIEIVCARAMNPVRTPDAVMRRSVLAAIGGYEPKLGHAGDLLMWLQAGARGAIGRINGVDQAFYRTHGANMHVEVFGGELVDLDQKRQTFEVLFADDRAPVRDGERLHAVARQALAREALLTAHRLLARNSLPWDEVEKFVAFARETWPPITTTRLWRTHERYAARVRLGRTAVPPATVRAQRAWDDVAGPIRWRRWRQTGIMPAYGSL